jgi:hypothetical protein
MKRFEVSYCARITSIASWSVGTRPRRASLQSIHHGPRLSLAAVVGAFVLLPWTALAVAPASSSINLDCTDGQLPNVSIAESGLSPLSNQCTDSVDFGSAGSRSASATAQTFFSASPSTASSADAGTTGNPSGAAAADGIAIVQYELQISQTQVPPVPGVTTVPVTFAASGSVTGNVVSFLAGSSSVALATFVGPGVNVLVGASDGNPAFPSPSFDSQVAVPAVEVGGAYTITVRSQCSADASGSGAEPTVATAHCTANAHIDFLSFDQAAFDVAMGSSSFPLADYFAFEQSANLALPVPALAPVAIVLLTSLLGVASLRRLRA